MFIYSVELPDDLLERIEGMSNKLDELGDLREKVLVVLRQLCLFLVILCISRLSSGGYLSF